MRGRSDETTIGAERSRPRADLGAGTDRHRDERECRLARHPATVGHSEGGAVQSAGIASEFATHYYEVSLTIADKSASTGPTFAPPDVSVIHLEAVGVDALIGLDLLVSCRLVLDGPARLFTLEF